MPDMDGLYLVKLQVTKEGLMGAPTLSLNLVVYAPNGTVNGDAAITQAILNGQIHIPQVSGNIHHTGFGKDQQLVSLSGQYVQSVPPPAIGSFLAEFKAALVVDASWNGRGTFSYGGHTIADATVKQID
ncbi:MAG TPA: DUF1842 domain-containing protein [Candidatus Omnitrophota bacterium]|nr:DUF1842 domain-containing protein [Candidatus Omnitrophota bacterium]